MIERRDGSLLALLRTSLGKLYRGWSTDAGETWSEPVATELDSPSVATCMKRIPGGDLLLIWNDTPPYAVSIPGSGLTHQPRNPLRSAISQDDGETWRNRRTIEDRFGLRQRLSVGHVRGGRGAGRVLLDRQVGSRRHAGRGAAEDLSARLVLPAGSPPREMTRAWIRCGCRQRI